MDSPRQMHWELLGGTRFFLASIIAIAHLTWFLPEPQPVLVVAKLSGLVAVLGFLLISGYSIAASHDRRSRGFYYRRILRIMPLYVTCVTASALIPLLLGSPLSVPHKTFETPGLFEWLGNLFFLQGITHPYIGTNPIVWTMTVEVFFYLATPLLARKRILALTAFAVSAAGFIYFRRTGFQYYAKLRYGMSILFLGWPWLLGFCYYKNRNSVVSKCTVLLIGLALIHINGKFLEPYWAPTWLITCCVLLLGHTVPRARIPSAILKVLGDASYPLYLIHIPAYVLIYTTGITQLGIAYFLLTSGIAILLDRYLDKPVKSAIDRLAAKAMSRTRDSVPGDKQESQ